jgi:micrococcal nuclease
MTKRQQRALITSVCLLILGFFGYSTTAPKAKPVAVPAGQFLVTHVTDGDTFDVQTSAGKTETVRMIGMDTPETHDPRKAVQCFGEVAAAKSKELLDGKIVRLEADPTDSDRDKYHRLLRFVYLPDGTFVNQYLVQQGYAFAYTVFPNIHLDDFRAWEKEARDANRGLWAGCKVDDSSEIKQTNNAN